MIVCDYISVFDLDGTLWEKNSHLYILNKYYNTTFYTSIIAKLISKFFCNFWTKKIHLDFSKIPDDYITSFNIEELILKKEICDLLKDKKTISKVIIISNAPMRIVKKAADYFSVDAYCADISKKSDVLKENYKFKKLFVCTDNSTDNDLLSIANEKIFLEKK